MTPAIDPYHTQSDLVVLANLFEDVNHINPPDFDSSDGSLAPEAIDKTTSEKYDSQDRDRAAIDRLKAFNDPNSPDFQPTVFVLWDDKDVPEWLNRTTVRPYAKVAARIVRHPTDVVFLTHILLYLFVVLPSAVRLFYRFSYFHAIAHTAFTFWCAGSYTLLMHNHIHNGGVLAKNWFWLDFTFPYLTEPLMGHTWDSYYYHHVKHHHVESNGPDDLSSTIHYQRDDAFHFLHYVGRFIFFTWLELPLYFYRKNKVNLAVRAFCSEIASFAFMFYMVAINVKASVFVLVIPFVLLRLGLMVGNWGQHALVDEVEPDSDFRTSITLVDVPVSTDKYIYCKCLSTDSGQSNRFCFNDGYHTAHHLNPRRHWREQPVHFLQTKEAYRQGRALVFHNIDYLMMTFKLLRKDYMHLASCLVPIGDQVGMSQEELADMLRSKTKQFTDEDIKKKFKQTSSTKT